MEPFEPKNKILLDTEEVSKTLASTFKQTLTKQKKPVKFTWKGAADFATSVFETNPFDPLKLKRIQELTDNKNVKEKDYIDFFEDMEKAIIGGVQNIGYSFGDLVTTGIDMAADTNLTSALDKVYNENKVKDPETLLGSVSKVLVEYGLPGGAVFKVMNRAKKLLKSKKIKDAKTAAQATGAGAWSTTNNLNTARDQIAGAGTTTSGLVFGENFGGETESFNGTSYTEQNDLNNNRRALAGAGASNTAALAFGGNEIHSGPNAAADNTESFNGTSWTELADLNQARSFTVGCGTNTAALALGGSTGNGGNPPITAENESWNGSSWTELGDLNGARNAMGLGGTTTSAIAFGGGPRTENTETWNGSTWTEVNNLNTARLALGGAGSSSTAAVAFGGSASPGAVGATELWSGSSWAEQNDLSNARTYLASSKGSNTAALAMGGSSSVHSEQWTDPVLATKTADTD